MKLPTVMVSLALCLGIFSEVAWAENNASCNFGNLSNKALLAIIDRSESPERLAYAYTDEIMLKSVNADAQEVWRRSFANGESTDVAIRNHITEYYERDLTAEEKESLSHQIAAELAPVETTFSVIVYLERVRLNPQLWYDIRMPRLPDDGIPSKQRYKTYFDQIFQSLRATGMDEQLAVLQAATEAHFRVEIDRGVNTNSARAGCGESRLLFRDTFLREQAFVLKYSEIPRIYWYPAGGGNTRLSYSTNRERTWNRLADDPSLYKDVNLEGRYIEAPRVSAAAADADANQAPEQEDEPAPKMPENPQCANRNKNYTLLVNTNNTERAKEVLDRAKQANCDWAKS